MTVLFADDWELTADGQYESEQQSGPGLAARVYPVLSVDSDEQTTGAPDEWYCDIRHDDASIWEGSASTRDAAMRAAEAAVSNLTWAYAEQYVRRIAEHDAEAVAST